MNTHARNRFWARSHQGPPPARPSALLLTLVRRSTRLWLGWLQERWERLRQSLRQCLAHHDAALERPRFETLEPKLLLSAELMPMDQAAPAALHRLVELPKSTDSVDTTVGAGRAQRRRWCSR